MWIVHLLRIFVLTKWYEFFVVVVEFRVRHQDT